MKSKTELGGVNISTSAIAALTASIVAECYGVVGMASKGFLKDGIAVLLKRENSQKGVVVKNTSDGIVLDIYVIMAYGVRLIQVANEVQKKVLYELERTMNLNFKEVNVYVQDVRVIS